VEKLIAQYLVQSRIDDTLHRKCFDVNMRLYRNNQEYNKAVGAIISLMKAMLETEFSDYAKLKGISGANISIPLNIIVIRVESKRGLPKEHSSVVLPEVFSFINPKITKHSKKTSIVKSNCGSINLSEPINVARYDWIDLEYYRSGDHRNGEKNTERYGKPLSFTIQHEVDHNAGVLITDKIVKEV